MHTVATPLPRQRSVAHLVSGRREQWAWIVGGAALFFLIPFTLTDLASIDRDLYYGIYIAAVAAFFGIWLRRTSDSPRATLLRNWQLGLLLGVAFAGVTAAIVLREPATAHPHGLAFAAAIGWRGVLYGLADGLILSAFPILAVVAAFEPRPGKARTAAIGALALAVSLAFTAVYHAGYSDFRSDKLRKPLLGDTIWSIPTLVTLSPIGAPIAHVGLHVAAVTHSYDTDTFLPPHAAHAGLDRAPLQRLLDDAVTGRGRLAPGATAFVATPDGTWSGSAGVADVTQRAPMPADARMRLESVSKIWTATLVYQLAEARKLRLSDTVERWLPGVLPYGDRITIAELLSHTSGLIDNNDVVHDPGPYLGRVTDARLAAEIAALGRRLQKDPTTEFSPWLWIRLAAYQPLLSPPGTQYHYSNIGFEILGVIAARAGGAGLAGLYDERLFAPLGLQRTAYDPQGAIDGEHARGYDLASLRDATNAHPGIGAEGGIVSDAADTATFLVALMRGELLGPDELAVMKTGFWPGGEPTGCGGTAFGHSGGGYGFKTDVWVAGDGSRVAVLLLNARGDSITDSEAGALMQKLYCTAAPKEGTR